MTSIYIEPPGQPDGPCSDFMCNHDRCRALRAIAVSPCAGCGHQIGYNVLAYFHDLDDDRFCFHAECWDEYLRKQDRELPFTNKEWGFFWHLPTGYVGWGLGNTTCTGIILVDPFGRDEIFALDECRRLRADSWWGALSEVDQRRCPISAAFPAGAESYFAAEMIEPEGYTWATALSDLRPGDSWRERYWNSENCSMTWLGGGAVRITIKRTGHTFFQDYEETTWVPRRVWRQVEFMPTPKEQFFITAGRALRHREWETLEQDANHAHEKAWGYKQR